MMNVMKSMYLWLRGSLKKTYNPYVPVILRDINKGEELMCKARYSKNRIIGKVLETNIEHGYVFLIKDDHAPYEIPVHENMYEFYRIKSKLMQNLERL